MKPMRKTKTVEIEYFDCGFGHQHKTEETAQACIDKRASKKYLKWDKQSRRRVLEMKMHGKSFSDIGVAYGGLSANRMRSVCDRALRERRRAWMPLAKCTACSTLRYFSP
jgi:hypothetical protein